MGVATPPEPYAVYVLELSKPGPTPILEERARGRTGMVPNHVYAAADSMPVLYVGSSGNMPDRLYEHLEGRERAANATAIFPPHALYKVEWFRSRREARRREEAFARELREAYPNSFVYQY